MTDPTPHLGDEIHELLDGRLDPAREAMVREHLAKCATCRHDWERLEWLRTRLRALSETASAPADLRQAVRHALEGEGHEALNSSASGRATTATPPHPRWRRPSLAAAAMAALCVVAVIGAGAWWWFRPPGPAEVARDFRSIAADTLRADVSTSDPRALARHFGASGVAPTGVFDLGPMQYRLTGGRVHAHRSWPATIAFYRGERDERLICEMFFAGLPSDRPIERRTHKGIEFRVYRHGDVAMVFWREGPVTCVLASTMDVEPLIQLAFAKAGG